MRPSWYLLKGKGFLNYLEVIQTQERGEIKTLVESTHASELEKLGFYLVSL